MTWLQDAHQEWHHANLDRPWDCPLDCGMGTENDCPGCGDSGCNGSCQYDPMDDMPRIRPGTQGEALLDAESAEEEDFEWLRPKSAEELLLEIFANPPE